MRQETTTLALWLLVAQSINAQYSATYLPSNVPAKTEQGQAGTNQCGTGSNQNSQCQNAFINSLTDFCLFAPPNPGPNSVIGNTERIEVAWCLQSGTGARLIPDGAITGAHFVHTPDFVQVTGVGDLTKINIPAGDEGGELDPHGADGNGNPIGGLVFSSAFGNMEQIHEWTSFVSDTQFCFRACKPGPKAATFCQHIYDVMGCEWNMPANYGQGFESCQGDSGEPMGVYGTSTFHQGQPATPPAHPVPSSSKCQALNTIGNGIAISTSPGATQQTAAPSHSTSASNSGSPTSSATQTTATASSAASASASGGPPLASGGTTLTLPHAALTAPPTSTTAPASVSVAPPASAPSSQTSRVPSKGTRIDAESMMFANVGLIFLVSIFAGFSFF